MISIMSRLARPPRTGHRPRAGVLLAAATLTLAACGTDTAPAPPATSQPAPSATPSAASSTAPGAAPTAEVLGWADSVCTALVPVVDAIGAPPPVDQNALPATREAYLRYLDDVVRKADEATQALHAAGPPPVEDGQQISAQLLGLVGQLRADLADARASLAAADPGDVSSFGPAVAAVTNLLASLGNTAEAIGKIVGDSQLRPAFEQAPACAPLR